MAKNEMRKTTVIEKDMEANVAAYNRYYQMMSRNEKPVDENGVELDLMAILEHRVKLNSEYITSAQREHFETILIRSKKAMEKNSHAAMLDFIRNAVFTVKSIKDEKPGETGIVSAKIIDKNSTGSLVQFIAFGAENDVELVENGTRWRDYTEALFYSLIMGIARKVSDPKTLSDYLIHDELVKISKMSNIELLKTIVSDIAGKQYAEKVTDKSVEFLKNCATKGSKIVKNLDAIKKNETYQRILGVCQVAVTGEKHGIGGYKTK